MLNQLTTRIIRGAAAYLQPAVGLLTPPTIPTFPSSILDLTPISSSEASPSWANAFTNRLLIFRHYVPAETLKSPETATSLRYISILKAGGVSYENEDGPIISVTIGGVSHGRSRSRNLLSPRLCVAQNGISDAEYLSDTDPNGTPRISQLQLPPHTPSTPLPLGPENHTIKSPHNSPQSTLPISSLKSQGKRKREIASSEDEDEEGSRERVYAAWGDGVELDLIQQVGFGEEESLGRFYGDGDRDLGGQAYEEGRGKGE